MDIQTAKYWFTKTSVLTRQRKCKKEKQEVLDQTQYLASSSSLPQRLWHIIHQIDKIPGCKVCKSPVSWDRRYKHYKKYCGSPKCPNSDPDIIKKKLSNTDVKAAVKKRQQTNKQKYGHSNYLASDKGKQDVQIAFDNQTTEQKNKRYNTVKKSRLQTQRTKYGVDNILLT